MRSTTFDIGGIGLPVKALGMADIFAPWGDIAEFESHARTRYHAYKVGEPEDMKAALEVEAPGCTEDEIDVSVNTDSANKNILLIKARRKEGGPRLGRDFEHSFQLPNGAEVEAGGSRPRNPHHPDQGKGRGDRRQEDRRRFGKGDPPRIPGGSLSGFRWPSLRRRGRRNGPSPS